METFSARIKSKDRAGRAPYNFVPLPDHIRKADPPPDANQYHSDRLTGEISIHLKALTDFYTRGMWALEQYRKQSKDLQTSDPFQVDGRLRLPGSSIRGMIRTMVEILSGSRLDPINNTQLFFRAVASVPEPSNKSSFEPQAYEYKDRLGLLNGGQLSVQAGYLYANWDSQSRKVVWEIKSASYDPGTKRQWYRYRTSDKWSARKVRFDPDGEYARISPGGSEEGWLVCSGPMPRKTKQWVIRSEDKSAGRLPISRDLVEAYKENGVTRELKGRFEFSDATQGSPCFYTLNERNEVTGFGHTGYFRMPYRRKPQEAIPASLEPSKWDLGQAMFGRSATKTADGTRIEGARSRVFFEDAEQVEGPNQLKPERALVLGQPQPTTYQHYLVQPSDQLREIRAWDGDYQSTGDVVLRGHKLYWHRPGAPLPPDEADKDRVSTRVRLAPQGAVFSARIRFENLTPVELGALLTALWLPSGCAHHLGLGKPLGLGSFELHLKALVLTNAAKRYNSFLTADKRSLALGMAHPEALDMYRNAFAGWYETGRKWQDIWRLPRFKELLALLKLSDNQQTVDWWNATRYLEFGPTEQRNYNEYLQVGYPNKRLEKRRPLPPASQVFEMGELIPKDSCPIKRNPDSNRNSR